MLRVDHIKGIMPHRILIESFKDEKIILGWLKENIGVGVNVSNNIEWARFIRAVWYLSDYYYTGLKPRGAYFYFRNEEDAMAFKLRWS